MAPLEPQKDGIHFHGSLQFPHLVQVVSDIVCNRRLSDSSYRTSLPRAPPDVFGDHTSQFSEVCVRFEPFCFALFLGTHQGSKVLIDSSVW